MYVYGQPNIYGSECGIVVSFEVGLVIVTRRPLYRPSAEARFRAQKTRQLLAGTLVWLAGSAAMPNECWRVINCHLGCGQTLPAAVCHVLLLPRGSSYCEKLTASSRLASAPAKADN
jgi:hypothetical protein